MVPPGMQAMTDTGAKGKQAPTPEGKVCLGVIVGARGLRGDLRIKSFTEDPADIAAYGPVDTDDGQSLTLKITGEAKGVVIARSKGIEDRTQADTLKGQRLYVARDALPETDEEDEYYHADLIGLDVMDETDEICGTVIALYNFGGGDMIDVRRPDGSTLLLLFTPTVVPVVDVSAGRIVVDSTALAQAEAAPDPPEQENQGS